jgi:hypothetical protein
MKKVFIVHGFEGEPNGGWRPFVMRELAKHDVYACSLSMPTPAAPILSEWTAEIARHVERNTGDEIILVGHSLGGAAIVHYLQSESAQSVSAAVFVSTPCTPTGNPAIAEFLAGPFDWPRIRAHAGRVSVVHGDNDPLVPLADAETIARELGGTLTVIPNGQHLNGSAGFTELPELLPILI